MRKRAASSYLLGFAALAAACQQPATSNPGPGKIPDESHRSAVAAPSCTAPAGWSIEASGEDPDQFLNTVSIDSAGTTHWNGVPIDRLTLRQYMDIVSTMFPTPGTVVEVEPGAPCAPVTEAVKIIGHAVECERHCSYATRPFDRPAPPPPSPPRP